MDLNESSTSGCRLDTHIFRQFKRRLKLRSCFVLAACTPGNGTEAEVAFHCEWSHAEQGNVLKAKDDLEKVRLICGNTECRPYQMLKDVIDGTATY